ncbi:uracil-DNA glycosylase family protein [Planktomarina temperata]|nr:uracil-DNA glycosylase family protein [Planktomarina temperata]
MAHEPRPVVWAAPEAKILIAGQAPGLRVHHSGRPFDDRSGQRLRQWMGLSDAEFFDQNLCAILSMAFCFPGYNAAGHDLAPPAICAKTWRDRALKALPQISLTLLIGSYAQAWHLRDGLRVNDRLRNWRAYGENSFVLPHPSWRNTAWIKRNPWFETELIAALQARIGQIRKMAYDPA